MSRIDDYRRWLKESESDGEEVGWLNGDVRLLLSELDAATAENERLKAELSEAKRMRAHYELRTNHLLADREKILQSLRRARWAHKERCQLYRELWRNQGAERSAIIREMMEENREQRHAIARPVASKDGLAGERTGIDHPGRAA